MIARLGNVIYWTCCAAAILFISYVLLMLRHYPSLTKPDEMVVLVGSCFIAGVMWLLGRAIRNVLAGK